VDSIAEMKQYSKAEKEVMLREFHTVRQIGDAMSCVENHTDVFVKKEILNSNTRIGRVISARVRVIRNVTQCFQKYLGPVLSRLPPFVKGYNSWQIAEKCETIVRNSDYVFCGDISSYDNAQTFWVQQMESIMM